MSKSARRDLLELLCDVNPRTGAAIEVFYADDVLAKSFDTRPGWFWWSCRRGSLPDGQPIGPFATSYRAYRNVASRWMPALYLKPFGRRLGAFALRADVSE